MKARPASLNSTPSIVKDCLSALKQVLTHSSAKVNHVMFPQHSSVRMLPDETSILIKVVLLTQKVVIRGICSRLINTLRAVFLIVALGVKFLAVVACILPIVIAVLIALAFTTYAATMSRAGFDAFTRNDFTIFLVLVRKKVPTSIKIKNTCIRTVPNWSGA